MYNSKIGGLTLNVALKVIKNSTFKPVKLTDIVPSLTFIGLNLGAIYYYNSTIWAKLHTLGLFWTIPTCVLWGFVGTGVYDTGKLIYYNTRYRRLASVLNNDAQVINYIKEDGKETYTLNSYMPISAILAKEKDIEQYLNTNVVAIRHRDTTNKRIIELKCSKLPVSEYSGSVKKLQNVLKKLNFNPEILGFDENEFVYFIKCTLSAEVKAVQAKVIEITFGTGSPTTFKAVNNIYEFEIRKQEIQIFNFSDYIDALEPQTKEKRIPMSLGLSHQTGKPVVVDLAKESILHTFINGRTGSGKSCLFNTMIQSILVYRSENIAMLNVDFKGNEFFQYKNWSNSVYIKDIDNFKKLLDWVIGEIDRRYTLFQDKKNIEIYNKNRTNKMPYILFNIDEVAFITNSGNIELFDSMSDIVCRCRACGIYFLAATQRPEAAVVPTKYRNQFDSTFCGRTARPEDNKVCNVPKEIPTKDFNIGEFIYLANGFSLKIQGLFIDEEKKGLNLVYEALNKTLDNTSSKDMTVNGSICLDKNTANNGNILDHIKPPSAQVLSVIEEVKAYIEGDKKSPESGIKAEKSTKKTPTLYMRYLDYLLRECKQGGGVPTMNQVRDDLEKSLTTTKYRALKERAAKEKYLYKETNGRLYVDLKQWEKNTFKNQ